MFHGMPAIRFLRWNAKAGHDARRVACRRQAEGPCIFTAELGRAFIAHVKRGGGDALAGGRQQGARAQQPDAFLVLQGAHGGDGLEVAVEGRYAHHRLFGQCLHRQRLVEIAAYHGDRAADAGHRRVGRGDLAQHGAMRPLQYPVQDFPLIGGCQRGDIKRPVHQAQHAHPGVHQFLGHGRHRKPGHRAFRPGRFRQVGQQAGNDGRIERQRHGQVGFARGGRPDGADGRQVDRHHEIIRGAVVQHFFADRHRLAALQDQVDHRLIHGRQFVFGDGALHHGHARDAGFRQPVLRLGGQGPAVRSIAYPWRHLNRKPDKCTSTQTSEKQDRAGLRQEAARKTHPLTPTMVALPHTSRSFK